MSSKRHWIAMYEQTQSHNQWLTATLDEHSKMEGYLRNEVGWWAFGERGVANRCKCDACNPIAPPVTSVEFEALWEQRKVHSTTARSEFPHFGTSEEKRAWIEREHGPFDKETAR